MLMICCRTSIRSEIEAVFNKKVLKESPRNSNALSASHISKITPNMIRVDICDKIDGVTVKLHDLRLKKKLGDRTSDRIG